MVCLFYKNLRSRRGLKAQLALPLTALALQMWGGACLRRGADAPAEAAPAAIDQPEDLPRCGCKTPCAAHVEKAPCACKKAEPAP